MTGRDAHQRLTDADYFDFWEGPGLRHADTDDQGHVNHCALVNLLETARDFYFRRSWPTPADPPSIVIVGLDLRFRKELNYPSDVRIGTRLERAGTSSMTMAQAIFVDRLCIATAEATCVLIDGVTRRPRPVPDEIRPAARPGL
jgi:acyl-CoA thioester hydrolase